MPGLTWLPASDHTEVSLNLARPCTTRSLDAISGDSLPLSKYHPLASITDALNSVPSGNLSSLAVLMVLVLSKIN